MGRNLYILAATLAFLALVSVALSFTNIAQQPGSPGDVALWRNRHRAFLHWVDRRAGWNPLLAL